jgi:hypothetical protein
MPAITTSGTGGRFVAHQHCRREAPCGPRSHARFSAAAQHEVSGQLTAIRHDRGAITLRQLSLQKMCRNCARQSLAIKQRLCCVALGDLQKVTTSVLEHCSRHWSHRNWRLSELDAQLRQPVMLLVYIINSK